MAGYTVRSGQNIYDVALTLYGSVEGIFDLLACNSWLTMNTTLKAGMTLDYHDGIEITPGLKSWLENNHIAVKNGEHVYDQPDMEKFIRNHVMERHAYMLEENGRMSADELQSFWKKICSPRLMINHKGRSATIRFRLGNDTHLFMDWGDHSVPEIFEGGAEWEAEHCYKGDGAHVITLYGDFVFDLLDISGTNGPHYPLDEILACKFTPSANNKNLNKLIHTR